MEKIVNHFSEPRGKASIARGMEANEVPYRFLNTIFEGEEFCQTRIFLQIAMINHTSGVRGGLKRRRVDCDRGNRSLDCYLCRTSGDVSSYGSQAFTSYAFRHPKYIINLRERENTSMRVCVWVDEFPIIF